MDKSLLAIVKDLQLQLNGKLNAIDLLRVSRDEAKLIESIKRGVADLRLDVRDYEFADTRDEQKRHAKLANARLTVLRQAILAASQYDIFDSIDVAHLGVQLESLAGALR